MFKFPMSHRYAWGTAMACAVLLLSAAQLSAGVILPPGPPPVYEIAFVTSDSTLAISSNIADYNTFVTTEANQDLTLAGLGVSWNAIVSTGGSGGVNADTNAPSNAGIPVYNTQGQLVTIAGLYSGGNLSNPILFDQFGTSSTKSVWTGSTSSGIADPIYYMASSSGSTEVGVSVFTNPNWIADFPAAQAASSPYPVYALSSPITTPEPSCLALSLAGAVTAATWWNRRRAARWLSRLRRRP